MSYDVPEAVARGHGRRAWRILKDGYWDRTEVVELPDGSLRVRKSARGDAPPGPWGVPALRREIEYLATLPEPARAVFAALLARFDDDSEPPLRVGYEVPFYSGHVDAGRLARERCLAQVDVDAFQEALADAILLRVHEPAPAGAEPLSEHVTKVIDQALSALELEPDLAPLIRGASVSLNGARRLSARAAYERLLDEELPRRLDDSPQVRLHGDLFLENVLWREEGEGPQLLLIDPVSVAGVAQGPPLFDLVKYESYATGELFALRSGLVEVGGFDSRDYRSRVCWEAPALAPFRERNWHARLRRRFEARYGTVDQRLARLLDGYFSLAMAVNTHGVQRRARLLKATTDFNDAGNDAGGSQERL